MHTSISHFFDLHQERYDLTQFTSEVMLENFAMYMENLHKSAQIPLLRVRLETFCGHFFGRKLYYVLVRKGRLQFASYIKTHLYDKLINQLCHIRFNLRLHVV